MKIAVNTRLLLKDKMEGIGWFTYETLKRITTAHPEHQFYFLFDRPHDRSFIFSDNITPVTVFPQARHPFLFYWWFDYSVPLVLRRIKPDLFVSPDGYLSLTTRVRQLAVMHDLNFEHYPGDLPFLMGNYYRYFFPRFARKAAHIVTVSGFSKKDIMERYGIAPEKIDVVYNGASDFYRPVDITTRMAIRTTYSRGSPYFVFVGALHPRKNLVNLFKAFDRFKDMMPSDLKLVIVGARQWWTTEMRDAFHGMVHRDEVIFTGRLPSEALHLVVASALALTYVSYFEGFGIPILEAFYCDTPVITSNVTSIPEVAGDAALMVDPFSIDAIATAMFKIATDEHTRLDLITKARVQREKFNWDKTADRLWQAIVKTIKTS